MLRGFSKKEFAQNQTQRNFKKILSTLVLVIVFGFIFYEGVAFAAHEASGDSVGWGDRYQADDCNECHNGAAQGTTGPHGGYTAGSNSCQICHKSHGSDSESLLPGETVTQVCQFCHDITGTKKAPYFNDGSEVVVSGHLVQGLFGVEGGPVKIPGGNLDLEGENPTLYTEDQGKLSGNSFTCDSCHTPHGDKSKTVNIYLGESEVKDTVYGLDDGQRKIYITNRLLKRTVNGIYTGETYGTNWCAGCHQGYREGMALKADAYMDSFVYDFVYGRVYNEPNILHPVFEGPGYDLLGSGMNNRADWINGSSESEVFGRKYVLIDSNATPAGDADLDFDPRSNKWYAMLDVDPMTGEHRPDGSVPFAAYEGPSCQQCHASPRDVDEAFWVDFDTKGTGYPSRGTFPHLSTNSALLVEEDGDDLCTNCHS